MPSTKKPAFRRPPPPDPTRDTVTGRVIYRLKKKRSRTYHIVTEDPESAWFIYFYYLDTKTDAVKHRYIFIAKDITTYIRYLQRNGWELETVNSPIEETARMETA
jgi:hypothetical protein